MKKNENPSIRRLMQTHVIKIYTKKIDKLPFAKLSDKTFALSFFLSQSRSDATRLVLSNRFDVYRNSNREVDKALQEFIDGIKYRYQEVVKIQIEKAVLNIELLTEKQKKDLAEILKEIVPNYEVEGEIPFEEKKSQLKFSKTGVFWQKSRLSKSVQMSRKGANLEEFNRSIAIPKTPTLKIEKETYHSGSTSTGYWKIVLSNPFEKNEISSHN